MTSTLEVLRNARALYAANPSHAPLGTYTRHCPVAYISRVSGDLGAINSPLFALAEAAELGTDNVIRAIAEWNAASSTAEVLTAFDRAIQKLAEPIGERPLRRDEGLPRPSHSGRRLRENSHRRRSHAPHPVGGLGARAMTPPVSAPPAPSASVVDGLPACAGLSADRLAAASPVDPARARGGRPSAVATERRLDHARDVEREPDPWEATA